MPQISTKVTWLVTYLGVVMLDVDVGLVIGLGISIFTVIVRDQFMRLKSQVKSSDPSLSYIDETFIQQSNATQVRSLHRCQIKTVFSSFAYRFQLNNSRASFRIIKSFRVFKVQNPIYFVNCESFVKSLYKLYGKTPFDKQTEDRVAKSMKPTRSVSPISRSDEDKIAHSCVDEEEATEKYMTEQCLILDLSAVNYIDTNGIKALLQLINDYQKANVNVYICNPQGMNPRSRVIFCFSLNLSPKNNLFRSLHQDGVQHGLVGEVRRLHLSECGGNPERDK